MYFTATVQLGGQERTLTWRDGTLSGDAFLIAVFLEEARYPPIQLHPVGYSPVGGWRADPYVAQSILAQIAHPIRFRTNIPIPYVPPGAIV